MFEEENEVKTSTGINQGDYLIHRNGEMREFQQQGNENDRLIMLATDNRSAMTPFSSQPHKGGEGP